MTDHPPSRTLAEAWSSLCADQLPTNAPPAESDVVEAEPVPVLEGWRFFPTLRVIESPSGETILHAERAPTAPGLERLLRSHLVGLAHPDALPCAEIEQSTAETRAALDTLAWARSRRELC